MYTRKFTQFAATGLLVLALVGCAPAATPTMAPTAMPEPTAIPATPVPAFDVEAAVAAQLAALPDGFSGIKVDVLKEQLAAAAPFLLDLRDAGEIAEAGYIEGAVNIPIRELAQNLDKLPAQDMPIVAICKSGHRGGIAIEVLQLLGYTNVKAMTGGMNAWIKAEFPVVMGEMPAPVAGTAPVVDAEALAAVDAYLSALPDGFGTMAPAALSEQIAAAAPFMLDVREAKEVTEVGYIEGAVNVPTREVGANLDKLPAKDAPIIVVCASGHRGAIVMAGLQMMGYTNVKSLAGGMNAWVAAELPVVK